MKIDVDSEIGKLNGVILHSPGKEVENMTPRNAERALYSDILSLTVAAEEYSQFKNVLKKLTRTFETKDLLTEVLSVEKAKKELLKEICENEGVKNLNSEFAETPAEQIANYLIEGLPLKIDTLTKYLSGEKYSLQPLHNFFFMRDASVAIKDQILISKMKSFVRQREAIIMDKIFRYHPSFMNDTVRATRETENYSNISFEGGDILVVRDDVILIGNGVRTSTQGIDFFVDQIKEQKIKKHLIIQQLPHAPESFIHLDMVFTMLNYDECMIYEPAILNQHDFETVHITIDNGKVISISEEINIIKALGGLGISLNPLRCGGSDEWSQEREQWHSGANFFAVAPGKVLSYNRNLRTLEEMNKNGYEILHAEDFLDGKANPENYEKVVITVEGAELARGGGGCRCMTMPINRDKVDF
ncbi:MAG: arginine deiminase [Chlorobi bacterium]|nr:arginine deiminase [Chlorobiota bacterium]